MGQQFEKIHATTVIVVEKVEAARFISYRGSHAGPQNVKLFDVQGVSESAAEPGEAVSVITSYSALVEVGDMPIMRGDYVKPTMDGTGRAEVALTKELCGIALGDGLPGQLVEVEIRRQRHL